MKKYMCVFQNHDDNLTGASFFDSYAEARDFKMNCECGLGWYCEIYSREVVKDEEANYEDLQYVFLEA